MNRKETTEFLTDLLISTRLSDRKYYAREVTLDYGTVNPKRIDVMEFKPEGVTFCSDIEKGIFICYEIKSCVQDVYSGNGLNFYGEQNYIVTTMDTYKKLINDTDKLEDHIKKTMGVKTCPEFGCFVAVPEHINLKDVKTLKKEYDNPTKFEDEKHWKLWKVHSCRRNRRNRSMNELLFCMLRSKHNYTNNKESENVN